MTANIDQLAQRMSEITPLISPIQGWVSNHAGMSLYQMARFHTPIPTVVELGSWRGKSTAWLAFGLKDRGEGCVYAVDHWEGSASEDLHKKMLAGYQENQLYNEFLENMKRLGLSDYVVPLKFDTIQASRQFDHRIEVGLLHVDASHDYFDVRRDFEFWSPMVKVGGFIVFDDVPGWPGPTKVVSELPGWYRQVNMSHNQCIVQKLE